MERDDQQLVGRLAFDIESSAMEKEDERHDLAATSQVELVTATPWWHIVKDREELCELLHSQKAQYIIIALVVIDCIIVVAELLVDLEILKLHHENPAPHILHYTSIAILSLFIVELIVKLYAMRLVFFKHKLEVLDGIVVVVSFSLDIAFSGESAAEAGAGLLVILRLWRVTRIVNGIVLSVKLQAEKKIEHLEKENSELMEEIEKLKNRNSELEKELEALKGDKQETDET